MKKLSLLFTKDGLQWQISQNNKVLENESYFISEEGFLNLIEDQFEIALQKKDIDKVEVLSAFNHFTLMPEGFAQHEMANTLISYNGPTDEEKEELMLSVNKKFGVQFYYNFPKYFYHRIKSQCSNVSFNFSGEKFLNSIKSFGGKEVHIHLYHHQVEFFALEGQRLVLYNNLDAHSEVDFLYFILFTIHKIDFSAEETRFFIYGEMKENETFISELKKYAPQVELMVENREGKNFIMAN